MFGFTPCSIEREFLLLVLPLECCPDRSLCHPRGCSPERKLFFGRHCRPFLFVPENRQPQNQSINRANITILMARLPMVFGPVSPLVPLIAPQATAFPFGCSTVWPRAEWEPCQAINYLKLLIRRPLQRVKQIEGCSENQHLRNCGSYVRSNKGPAR